MSNLLATGSSALLAFQRALNTVSHNVANVNTPGYSRQRAEMQAREGALSGYGYEGTGVLVTDIRRMADSLATSRLLDSGGELSRLQQLTTLTGRLDALFSDDATSINKSWSGFFDSVSALSSNAASPADRENLLAQAGALAARFNQIDQHLDGLDAELNASLTASVAEVNRLASEIAVLNGRIGGNGQSSGDLLDRRDELIRELVSHTGGSAVAQDSGLVNVFTAGGQPLVVGTAASRLVTSADPYRPDRLQVALETGFHRTELGKSALGGQMGAILEFRGNVLDPALGELGRVATSLAQTFNAGHAAGMDQYGQLGADFFALPAPSVAAHRGNSGGAVLTATASDLAALKSQDVVLRFDGASWTAVGAASGAPVAMSGTGTAADPLLVNGVSLVVTGAPAAGDRFGVMPTSAAAGGIAVAITDPARIAAATPVKASSDLGNLGTGRFSAVRVTNAADANLLAPASIEFIDANQYTIDGAGPFAYTPGQAIEHNGWSLVLDGAPVAGDRFGMGPTGANSSDNGNAGLLANLDDARVLNGGTLTLNGALGGMTTSVGSAARQADYAAEAQLVIHDQALAARDSISGVNLDEEAAELMRLQQAYQAASQIIATADTLFQSLLNAVRR